MAENTNEMDWDAGLEAEYSGGEFNIPPIGEYGFKVINLEKTHSKAGNKMAVINLELDETAQFWKVYDYLTLTENNAWKLAKFFECIGLKKKGEKLKKMPWDKVLGAEGRVKIKHDTYNGKESCKVDQYIVTEASQADKELPDMPFEI